MVVPKKYRKRNRPRPARFAAVFGTLAVVVTLYHAATQPWASVDSPDSAARRRLAEECAEPAANRMKDEMRLHTSFPGPAPKVTGGMYKDTLTEPGIDDTAYKCPVDENGELFQYIATVEECYTTDASGVKTVLPAATWNPGVTNFKGSNRKKCVDISAQYTPNTIDVIGGNSDIVEQRIEDFLTVSNYSTSCAAHAAANAVACSEHNLDDVAECIADTACFVSTWTTSEQFVTDWKLAICHLLVGTHRDAVSEDADTIAKALVSIMQEWSTHDDEANEPEGELDSVDFKDMMSKPIFQWGPFILYVFCTFYLFCGIAIVCDDFFTASLESLSIKFELSEDVAGATFMAAGSSAPELFTSLSSVIITDECANRSSVGVGTIVGSAIFNILVIIGATCMLAGGLLPIGWKPMIRDTCWYGLSIALLIIFVLPEDPEDLKEAIGEPGCGVAPYGTTGVACVGLSRNQYIKFDSTGDGQPDTVSSTGVVTWWEGLIMWVAYLLYIVFMHFNEAILGETADKVTDEEPEERVRRKSVAGDEEENDADKKDPEAAADNTTASEDKKDDEGDEDDDDGEVDCLGVPKPEELGDKIFTYFSYPWYIFFMITIPDCESEKWKNWYVLSFVNSIIWIGVICYGMVEFAIAIGQICDISSTVMGLTVLSAGTSVPDAISSIVVAQRGLGDMAISNALGSNVFDILLGLGFPYFLSAIKEGKPVTMCVDDVSVYLACLVIVLIIVVGTFAAFKFVLRPIMGVILIFTYVLFFLMAVLRDQGAIDMGLACDAGH